MNIYQYRVSKTVYIYANSIREADEQMETLADDFEESELIDVLSESEVLADEINDSWRI